MVISGGVEVALLRAAGDMKVSLGDYLAAPQSHIPIAATDPELGPPDAPLKLVVFSSFQCPACKVFSSAIHWLNREYPRELNIVFKSFPLGKDCNPYLAGEMQPRACAAAFAAEAANRQQRFWQFHDGLFFTAPILNEDALQSVAQNGGLNVARWDTDRNSVPVKNKVEFDVEIGHLLNVDGTPAVFLNGRRVRYFRLPVLELLILRELNAHE